MNCEFRNIAERNIFKSGILHETKKSFRRFKIIYLPATEPTSYCRVIIIFKDAKAAFDDNLTTPYKKQLYPDLDKLAKDEQHRFELLLAHWDVMTEKINLANQ